MREFIRFVDNRKPIYHLSTTAKKNCVLNFVCCCVFPEHFFISSSTIFPCASKFFFYVKVEIFMKYL